MQQPQHLLICSDDSHYGTIFSGLFAKKWPNVKSNLCGSPESAISYLNRWKNFSAECRPDLVVVICRRGNLQLELLELLVADDKFQSIPVLLVAPELSLQPRYRQLKNFSCVALGGDLATVLICTLSASARCFR